MYKLSELSEGELLSMVAAILIKSGDFSDQDIADLVVINAEIMRREKAAKRLVLECCGPMIGGEA